VDVRQAPEEVDVEAIPSIERALRGVLDSGSPVVPRLGYARATVSIRVEGEHERVFLDLDGVPSLGDPGRSADLEIGLTPEQGALFARGELHMPTVMAAGTASFSGPIRQYLEVDPVMRRLLTDQSGADRASTSSGGRPIASIDPDVAAIEARNVHKSFGRSSILRGVDIQIPEGVIATVLGPSGTGKSVLLQHIIGLLAPDHGDVIIHGRPLKDMSRSELLALRTDIGVMFQDGALFSIMDVYNNVAFPLRQHTDLSESDIKELVMERLQAVGLESAATRYPNELSGGMRKRAGLARAMVLDPRIILCVEPDSGLDPVRTKLLAELLVEQHALTGGTMVVITHNIPLIKEVSEHISVLYDGTILESGPAEQIYASEKPFLKQFLAGEAQGPLGMD
jgi:phospholipid/cholesterol/gamma-HCH transport system ATP-binding protein